MDKVVYVKNVETNSFRLFKSIESLCENMPDIKAYTCSGEIDANPDWIKNEIALYNVASIHAVKPGYDFCGIHFDCEIKSFVVSYVEVK